MFFFYKIGTPGKHHCCAPVDKCNVSISLRNSIRFCIPELQS